jgi:tetratricopeptide (TPR) repeat protein
LYITKTEDMFFNNDDDEDDFGEDFKPIEQLLQEFEKAKLGEKNIQLDEEEIEFLIDFFESSGDKENVKLAFEMGTSMFPFSSAILLRKAEWLTEQTKFGQALKALDDADLIDPHNIESLFLRVDILSDTNKHEEAIFILEENLPVYENEDKCDILLEMSEMYDELEDFDRVYDSLKRVLEYSPQHEEAMLRICFWADITNNQEDAILLYQKVLDENPFNTVAWYNLGVAYQGLKLFEKSVDAYTTCLDLDEKFEYAYRNLGDAHIQLKEFDKAIEVLEKHLSLGTPEDVILEAIAYCWEKKKEYAVARNFYRQASQLNPKDDQIFFKIGETYTKENDWEKAMKSYSVALHLNKDNSVYCLALANCLMELNAIKEALVLYLNAVRLKPGTKTTWLALVRGLYIAEYYDEAIAQLNLAESICGAKPEFIYYRSAVLLATGKTKDAVLYLEEALTLAPKKVSALNQLEKEIIHHPTFTDVIAQFKKKK